MELAHVTCRFCGAVLLSVSLNDGGIRHSRFFGSVLNRDFTETDRAEAQCVRCAGWSAFRRSLLGGYLDETVSSSATATVVMASTTDSTSLGRAA